MKKLVLSVAIMLVATAMAGEDHSVGNGGDVIRKLFIDAKRVAAHKLRRLKQCSFEGQNDLEAITFALQNSSKLANEVVNSAHYWTVDQQATCAYTTRESNAGIYLSYPTCHNSVHGMHEAVYILIHESTHHLGIVDERFGDRVATAIMNSESRDSCPTTGGEVFEPVFCQGSLITEKEILNYFQPGESTTFFTTLQLRRRERLCNKATGCQAWSEVPVEFVDARPAPNTIISQMPCKFHVEAGGASVPFYCQSTDLVLTLKGARDWGIRQWNGPNYIAFNLSRGRDREYFGGYIEGAMTNKCLWYKTTKSTSPGVNGNYFESETVFYSNYTPK
ncbi:MAG: hypothetical protein A4S09_10400 [Proteobacteria bacterium SG_bin7]|nr:MAG: hypothetical protein A4S09_10400 [Proteobacteria bacterium SG_bin7]